MSMMDAMNNPPPNGVAPPQNQAPMAPGQMPQQGGMRLGGNSPEEMASLMRSVMGLISEEIWEGDGSNQVAERLHQQGAQPAEVVGLFTGYYLMMATSAARTKGGMLPPIVTVAAAGQTASQLTDLALMFKMITPEEADDTAEAGALIGIEVLLQNSGNQMAPEEKQEYQDIATAIIKASPQAEQMADKYDDQAVEEVREMAPTPDDHEEPDGDEGPNPTEPSDNDGDEGMHEMPDGSMMPNSEMQPQGMGAALGGQ